MKSLPIDSIETDIISAVQRNQILILQAPPGSGKTTRVPQFLMKNLSGKILVLEPRRLAARMSAERISEELGQACGEAVGYQIRYERHVGPQTQTIFITEGLFLRTLLSEPALRGIDCVVLDEFHERHIHSDIALVMTRALQESSRPDLKLIIMSATLDTQKLQEKFPSAAVLKVDVPTYPVDIEFETTQDDRPLEWKVAVAAEALLNDKRSPGDILVFLPGAAEIRKAAYALSQSKLKSQFELYELRAELPAPEQRKVFLPSEKRKIILSTNVAETSLTIPGVTGVIDSGLAKMSNHAHWNGLPSLEVKNISQASAIQRAGRAGRTASGVARRLYTRADFLNRPVQERPEIQRMDLTQVILEMSVAAKKIFPQQPPRFTDFPWLDLPPGEGVAAAEMLLTELGAINLSQDPTSTGEQMSRWPVHPRLSRILEEGLVSDRFRECCLLVSLLNEGFLSKPGQQESAVHTDCDLVHQARLFDAAIHNRDALTGLTRNSIDPLQLKRIEKSFESLCRIGQSKKAALELAFSSSEECSPFARELLTGFPDRIVALRRNKSSNKTNHEVVFARGGLGQLSISSTVQDSPFAIALDANQVRRTGSAHFVTEVTAAAGVDLRTIKSFFASRIRNETLVEWDDQAERVRSVERTLLDTLVLEERPIRAEQEKIEQELFKQLKARWPRPFPDDKPIEFHQNKMALLKKNFPETTVVDIRDEDFELFLVHICEGKKSFTEIMESPLQDYIDSFIPWDLKTLLERELPAKWNLNSGRKVEINYVAGQPPWLASRIQDFFGTMETPRLLRGSLPVTVHLLAPNGQAVQVTTDLANFWKNTYPEVKKEMSRRYPRHYWPDDPKNAEPLTRRPKPDPTLAGTSRSK